MVWLRNLLLRRAARGLAVVAALNLCVVAAWSEARAEAAASPTGRIDLDDADLPPATVEVDLSQGMFRDLFGLGDAAIAGAADTLMQSTRTGGGSEGTRMAGEQLAAARQIVQLAGEVVREARARVYENAPDGVSTAFDSQLKEESWETIVRVRKKNETARIALLRNEGAVRGVFVVATNGREAVVANIVCDVSPENVKKLTSSAAKIGLENGLQRALDEKMQKFQHRLPPPRTVENDSDE